MARVKAPSRIGNERFELEGGSLLAAIVQSCDDAIISADLDGRILSWNPAAERIFRFTQGEITGQSIAVLISPDLRDEQRHIFDRVKAGEHVDRYETVRVTKTGERIDVSLTLSPLRNAMGRIVAISGIIRDITSQTRSQDALIHRLKFDNFLFELSTTFIGMTEQEIDANMASGLAHVAKFLGMDRVTLLELSPDRTGMSVAYSWSTPGVPKIPPAITKSNQPWWVGQVLRGEMSLLSHPDDLPDEAAAERAYLRQRGVQSAASIPLKVGGEIAGAIAIATIHRRVSWTDDLVSELRAIGDILWNALKRRRTMQALHAAREAAERAVRDREALRASEERYRGLAEQVIDGIFITARTARVLDANRAACDLLGYTLQELQTLRPEEVISAEDLPRVREMLSLAGDQIVRTEVHFRRKDGSVFTGDVVGRQLPDGRLQAVVRDISERKEAETELKRQAQQLQSYIDQAGDAIYVIDGESGRILNANARAVEMLGYSRDELLQLFAGDIERAHTPADIGSIHERTKSGVVQTEGIHRRKDGSTFPIEVRVTTLAPPAPHRVLAIVRDVSERKRLEHERAEAVRRKDEFLASIGHELRNPLAAIHTASHVLSRNPSPPQRAIMEEIISMQTTMMRRLVDDLLDLERISHGDIELKLGPVDLAECLRRAVALVQSTIDSRNQQLLLQPPPESVSFIADGTRLDQIVMNLLTNASKYSARGCRIELSGVKEDSNVVIRCKDNGEGIAPQHQQMIFEPFYRGSKTDLGYGEASVGLGLALVKRLTALHGGTISVESGGAGLGSKFTVRLPFVAPPSFQRTADAESNSAHMVHRPLSFVLVEDNPSVATALQAALEQAGHSVHSFVDAPSVLAGISILTPDAILIDIGLPGMDGYELAAMLKQQPNTKSALLVAITGFKRRDRVFGDVFDHYFNKPVDVDALLAVLEKR